MHGWTTGAHVFCSAYEGETFPLWVRGVKDTLWLDVSASMGDDEYVNAAIFNTHKSNDIETKVEGVTGEAAIFTVTAQDVMATDMKGKQEVGVAESTWNEKGAYLLSRLSLTLLRWKAE